MRSCLKGIAAGISEGSSVILTGILRWFRSQAPEAPAGKKLTREQAWAFCKAKLDARFGWDQTQSRYAAGGSCMKRFGYNL